MTTQKPTVENEQTTFSMACRVRATVNAKPETVWALLTDAARFPSWNSTVTKIEGQIADGQKLKLTVPSSPGRTFSPKVAIVEQGKQMVWSDGFAPMFKGVRTFTLTAGADGTTEFAMDEQFSGLMLPMIKGSLPDFAPIFQAYAEDLQRAAEKK